MNIAFHSEQLGVRGTEIALYDYAFYNQELLNNKSFIISNKNSELTSLNKFKSHFDVFLYNDFQEVPNYIDSNKIDAVYYIKAGSNDGKIVPNAKNLVHAVFQLYQPHGQVYAYVSKWLSQHMSKGDIPYVPHMVDILKYDHNDNYRQILNIPKDAIVFGYYGGPTSFNIDFAKQAIQDVVNINKNIYFIFMNVISFCDNPNIMFFDSTTDIDKKIGFINTCDACIHARDGGESFGLTIAEFSTKNKPVITTAYCTSGLNDLAHLEMLGENAIIYNDYDSLLRVLLNFKDIIKNKENWNSYQDYTPDKVMLKFKEVFLS